MSAIRAVVLTVFATVGAVGADEALAEPAVILRGRAIASLGAAVAVARAGDTIELGVGVYRLREPLHVSRGVSLIGAAPQLTFLDGSGLLTGLVLGPRSQLSHLSIANAVVGIEAAGAEPSVLRNLIVRDNKVAGVRIARGASVVLFNGTIVGNGVGVWAEGSMEIRSSLVSQNNIGLRREPEGVLNGHYNNVHSNSMGNYMGAYVGEGDVTATVKAPPSAADGWRIKHGHETVDRGDPEADYSEEPEPNGDRVNVGAYGNTRFALPSPPSDTAQHAPRTDDGGPRGRRSTDAVDPLPPSANLSRAAATGVRGGGGCSVAEEDGTLGDGSWILCVYGLVAIGSWSSNRRSRRSD